MKPAGVFLLIMGVLLTVAALILLPSAGERLLFVVSALAVELVGTGLLVRAHMAAAVESRR